ncbi:hypothetical protein ACFU96_27220 [Streptomyces sp. NPDC057620]|uniref:hypothetical protein n=1 Tax=Streptomyces sp. NPDC057620 TaxID=3346185 RepID=UPI0036753A31
MDDRAKEVRRVREAIAAVAADAPAAERARRLDEAMGVATLEWKRRRQEAVQEMKDGGMSLRDIGKEMSISFGRVRQILAEDLSDPEASDA